MSIKILIYIFLLFISYNSLHSQLYSIERFKAEFSRIDTSQFDEFNLNHFYQQYTNLLSPLSKRARFLNSVTGRLYPKYPLGELLVEGYFDGKIDVFFNSENQYLRGLSYLLMAGTGYSTRSKLLIDRLNSEEVEIRFWVFMSLVNLGTDRTTVLFDYLSNKNNLSDERIRNERLEQLFERVNKDSLRNTCFLRINDNNKKVKLLAIATLSLTGSNDQTEKALREIIKSGAYTDKALAINTMDELQFGNLKDLLNPLIDYPVIRKFALKALANSPTEIDREILIEFVNSGEEIEEELFDILLNSNKIASNKLWLKAIQTKWLPERYYFSLDKLENFYSDELLLSIHDAVENIKDPDILSKIIPTLGLRKDEKSLSLVFEAMRHEDSSVRYWATSSLKGNNSELIKKQVETLIVDSRLRTSAIVDLAIEHDLDTYHNIIEKLYYESDDNDWQMVSLEYLAAFPHERYVSLFKSILADSEEDFNIRRIAVGGLSKLKVKSSIELIIEASEQERRRGTFNENFYLVALSEIKGEKAKEYISKFKDFDDYTTQELAKKILEEWDE